MAERPCPSRHTVTLPGSARRAQILSFWEKVFRARPTVRPRPREHGLLRTREIVVNLRRVRFASHAELQFTAHQRASRSVQVVQAKDVAQLMVEDGEQIDSVDRIRIQGLKFALGARCLKLLIGPRSTVDKPAMPRRVDVNIDRV